MKLKIALGASLLVLPPLSGVASAQAPIVTMRLAKDQIATVKTSPGITTRLVFPEEVSEIICGDLYDPASGMGSFVVQRGGKDVYLKPVTTKGLSNMFVKTAQNDENVYSFDLLIVTADQAYRVVNVLDTQGVRAGKVKAAAARQMHPPVMPRIGVIDWKVASSLSGIALGAYSLPGSADLPEPPTPQELSTASSRQSSTRVPNHADP